MTIARAQMYRQLYQLGGIGTLPMDYGQPLQVPQQQQPMFTTTGSATSSPMLNYGQTGLGQAGGTSLSRRSYQEGGLSDFYKGEEPIIPRIENIGGLLDQAEKSIGQPANNFTSPLATTFSRFGMQEGGMGMDQEPMMQPQMQQPPLEGIMGAMPQDSSMMQQESGTEQTALLTIIQLLIEQGVPPEQAQELALQILQVFAQGGQPAVEEFANQLEQEEGMPENRTMMAGGGITGLYPRQGFFVKGVVKAISGAVKGVASAVKSVAKSPIGMIALSIAAPYAIGAMFPGFATLGGTGVLGGALRAGISNLAIQGITTGKINPKQALLAAAAGGALSGFQGASTGGINPDVGGIPDVYQPQPTLSSSLTSNVVPASSPGAGALFATGADVAAPTISATPTDLSTVNFSPAAKSVMDPTIGDRFTQGIDYLKSTGTNLMADPVGTIGRGLGSIYDTATQNIKDNPLLSVGGAFLAGQQFRAPLPGEDPNEYNRLKAEHDAQVAGYITQYGGGIGLRSSPFYTMEKAVDPFAGTSLGRTYTNNPFYGYADGGRIGYSNGTSLERQYLEKKGYGDMIKNMSQKEILDLYDSIVGTFSRRFQAEGSMPMGEPRKNPAGIMELDYRQKGGFVPPIGIKEKADDIPAMLSNNEFVFTADAVRNAGDGNVNKGAQRMYGLMKQLEAGGIV